MIKPKLWKGDDLKGIWIVSLKIDGVRMLRDDEDKPVSRNGKPLHNLDHIPSHIKDAEIFLDDWETSVSLVRTHDSDPVHIRNVYTLDDLDPRLHIRTVVDPSKEFINKELAGVTAEGYEGLVLRQGDNHLKVKPSETYDVKVTSMVEGTGRHKGRMGALVTEMGKVGTGFTDAHRDNFWDIKDEEFTIEVECMSLTKNGKFRHPRYVRTRFDK